MTSDISEPMSENLMPLCDFPASFKFQQP